MTCESCDTHRTLQEVPDDPGPPFRVCAPCARRLETFSLRPLEWFRLAARHGWSSYLLHDDFYDDDGVATQPAEPVVDAGLYPYPPREAWFASVPLALDVAYTKWGLPEPLLTVFARAPGETLACIENTLAERPARVLETVAYEICARALSKNAEQWIRARWAHVSEGTFLALAEASAACLPSPEGIDRVTEFLRSLPEARRNDAIAALSWFEGSRALDVIEELARTPVMETWGRTAAACGLHWQRACRWLEAGRPLGFIALDALVACIHYDTVLLATLRPRLIDPPSIEEIRQRLEGYRASDAVPRVRRAVDTLVSRAEMLRNGTAEQIVLARGTADRS